MSFSTEKINGYKRPSDLPIKGSLSDTDIFLISDGVDLYQVPALAVKNYVNSSQTTGWVEQENPDTPTFQENSETVLSIDLSSSSDSETNQTFFDDYIGSRDAEKIQEIHIKIKDRNSTLNYLWEFSWNVDNTTGTPTSKSPKNTNVELFIHYNVLDFGVKLTNPLFQEIMFDWNDLRDDKFNPTFYVYSGITKKEYSDDVKTYRSFTPYYFQFDKDKYGDTCNINCYKNSVGKEYAFNDFTEVSDSSINDLATELGTSYLKGKILKSMYLYKPTTLDTISALSSPILLLQIVIDITTDNSSTYDFSFLNSSTVFNKTYTDLGLTNHYTGVNNTIITSFTGEQYVGEKTN